MEFKARKNLKLILYPYLFVLKEGREIKHDFLDYSLLMLQVGCLETIRSPQPSAKNFPLNEFDIVSKQLNLPNTPKDIGK